MVAKWGVNRWTQARLQYSVHGCLLAAIHQSMLEFVIAGRSDKTPMSVHRKPLVSNPHLTPPFQSAISYANSQKLRFAEWDGVRGGWIAYTIYLPEGWRDSVNVVEDWLIMPSKRGKGSKREAPVDQAIEKTSKKPAPSVSSSRKAPSKKTKAGKKGKSPLLVPSAARESTTALVEEPIEFAVVPPKKKTKAGKESRSTPLVPSAAKSPPQLLWKNQLSPPWLLLRRQRLGRKASPPPWCHLLRRSPPQLLWKNQLSPPWLLLSSRV